MYLAFCQTIKSTLCMQKEINRDNGLGSLKDLSDYVISYVVFSFLHEQELVSSVSLVSRVMHLLSEDDLLWHHKCFASWDHYFKNWYGVMRYSEEGKSW